MTVFRRSLGHPHHGSGSNGGGSGEQKRNPFGCIGKLFRSEKVVRVSVSIPEGSTVSIPIDASSTVEQVRVEAIRRATAMRVRVPGDSVLRTGEGSHGAILFGEDRVMDVLDLVANHTFVLWFGAVSVCWPCDYN
jgi:hypothetical protein